MRKYFLLSAIIFGLFISQAESARGVLTNVFASWVSVTQTNQTITFPSPSRDVCVHNGSAVDVFVSLKGGTIANDGFVSTPNSTFMMNGAENLCWSDFKTEAISFKSTAGTASPVSVIVTY